MRCPNCEQENKPDVIKCKKCGLDLSIKSIWKPDFKWNLKAFAVIYAVLILIYIILRIIVV